tara:strand:- start:253 stop:525 length:273 start_codon:yes stop_codon:yes gene_type:complete
LEPETTFVKQNDAANKDLYFLGEGIVNVYNQQDQRKRTLIQTEGRGALLNEVAAAFQHRPNFSYESRSYCTTGRIGHRGFRELVHERPEI